jgi:hypothetical protein
LAVKPVTACVNTFGVEEIFNEPVETAVPAPSANPVDVL